MTALKELLASLWAKLNPVEPTPRYLFTFMACAAVAFAIAIAVGAAVAS
ncbi:hypothetical protein HKCCE3408_10985 [Rhodobacterales bacterium HKCCE3408]|nr:hypothetical protein [Rhodobacterales bacterium HKCCE3408]